jgi:hypothetical protein
VVVDQSYDPGSRALPRLAVRGGVAASSPAAPGPDSDWDAYVLLATIDLPAAAANIGATTITDERTISQLVVDAPTLEANDSTDFAADDHDHDSDYAPASHVGTTDEHPDATASDTGFMSAADKTKLDSAEASADANEGNASLLIVLKTVDGASSGLDADLLDGLHLASYGLSSHDHLSRYYTEAEQNALFAVKAQKAERIKAYRTNSQTISNVTVTEVLLQAQTIDDWAGYTPGNAWISDDGEGEYSITGQVQLSASSGGDLRHVELLHNADGIIAYGRTGEVGGSDVSVIQVKAVYHMSGSENVRMRVYHDAGGALNAEATSTWLEMVKL